MHSLCRDLYKRDSPVNVFMNQVDPDLVLSLCTAAQPPRDMLLFDPRKESSALLRDWLVYRGVQPAAEDSELVEQVLQDMEQKRNSPAIIGFTNFDVGSASKEFLRLWLSWFGVGSDVKQPRTWWQERARHVQSLRLSTQDHSREHLRMQWKFLVESQQRTDQMVKFVVCSGAALARAEWKAKRLARQDNFSADQDPVFAKYREGPPLSDKQIKKKWQAHARDLKIVNYASQIDVKNALAKAMRMSLVALPLVINNKGQLTTERLSSIKDGAKVAGTVAMEAVKSKDLEQVKQAIGKGVKAVKDGVDVNLAARGLSLALRDSGLGGLPSAVLPIMLRQWATNGLEPIELVEALSRTDPSLSQLLAAQLVLGATGQKTQSFLGRQFTNWSASQAAKKQ